MKKPALYLFAMTLPLAAVAQDAAQAAPAKDLVSVYRIEAKPGESAAGRTAEWEAFASRLVK